MKISRRRFLDIGIGAACTGCALMTGGVIVPYLVPPRTRVPEGPVPAGELEQLEKGPLQVPFRNGWALILFDRGRIRAFNPVCTHLGCLVRWRPDERNFLCPCHGGRFDADGKNIAGPPPRPLEVIPVRVRGKKIYLGS